MVRAIPPDGTLPDVLASVDKPESFVRQMLGVMQNVAKEHGPVVVRLGITGTGRAPNYRLESADSREPIMAIDGANHKPWAQGENFAGASNWSTAVMSRDEVASLLGEIRGYPGPKA